MDPRRFATHSLRDPRLLRILAAALDAADPATCVRNHLAAHPLAGRGKMYGLALGKAAVPMLDALSEAVPLAGGLAVTKHASARAGRPFAVMEGGHPVPDARSLEAGLRVLEFVARPRREDTLVCLISGGASALVSAPHAGIKLDDLQTLTSTLLESGAPIEAINTLRRYLDQIKGGGLLRRASAGQTIALILSDVVGNRLEAIGSGPTAPDPTTRDEAREIVVQHKLEERLPDSIVNALRSAPETIKPDDPLLQRVQNIIVGDNTLALRGAQTRAESEGFLAEIIMTGMQGEARAVGRELGARLADLSAHASQPRCLIAGGETTVTIDPSAGGGKGGRNQELALAAVKELDGVANAMLISLATDGDDGPTEAAGGVVTGDSARRAESLGVSAPLALSQHNSYGFFEALRDLLRPGYTGTNVNDLVLLVVDDSLRRG